MVVGHHQDVGAAGQVGEDGIGPGPLVPSDVRERVVERRQGGGYGETGPPVDEMQVEVVPGQQPRELARLLSRHDLDLHLVDGRPGFAVPSALPALDDALAHIRWHEGPWPDPVLAHLPGGTHVLVMTHDHAEDAALCDAALRAPVRSRPASVGLIGSRAKWRRIEKALRELGHPPESTARITCPIGDPGVPGKDPASIALSVAVDLLRRIAEPPTVPDPRGLPLRHGDRP